ncbi:MAG: hypothetical protein JWN08_436 [Frankiales bacterium]|nr:hypothetical protein [Frankiales bacterium]
MDVLGTVTRLQVQRSRLKPGERGARVYDPAPLLEVTALEIGPRGVRGLTPDGPVLDVHHADHPDTRNVKLVNGLSLLPRTHYARMRATYGPHVVDGAAGESLLLDTGGPWTDLAGPLELETADGWLLLTDVVPAPPCVEFSRFCLDDLAAAADGDAVRTALEDLDHGMRGFYARTSGTARVEVGARLRRA